MSSSTLRAVSSLRERVRRCSIRVLVALGLLSGVALAQATASQAAVDAARRALERGAALEAARHAQAALAIDSRSAAAFEVLLAACGADLDSRVLWCYELASALCDERGELALSRELAASVQSSGPHPAAIALARANAASELAELAARARKETDKDPERSVVSVWAAALAREVAYAAPSVHARVRDAAPLDAPLSSEAQRTAIDALARKLNSLQAAGDTAAALEIALVLRGLRAQAAFEDLEGPPPPGKISAALDAGEAALERARSLRAKSSAPLSIEELAAMDALERDEFTRTHASFANPGVSLSPRGWYRIETNCGHATLLGCAEVVEFHHTRLANWYGRDPFVGKPGLVRVVPESHGLESEGAPFWWAGGFQGGDTTTLRFSCSSIASLGRGLTHELTHRFDGVLHPGIPAWLAEGRAVWTADAYGADTDEQFATWHANFGTIDDARFRGYGGRERLERLVSGTIEDYRDNYVAGYALYVFLATWHDEGATPKFAQPLAKYQTSRRTDKRAPLASFVAHFCDGVDGRPKGFVAFAQEFDTFLAGFYWRERKPFTKRYLESAGASDPSPTVLDEPTWVWSRARAEPWFGQDQARVGARLLERHGDARGAIAAYLWSLAVDEPSSAVQSALADLLEKAGKPEGAWVLRQAVALRDGVTAKLDPCPLLVRLPRTRALLTALAAASAEAEQRGAARCAAALAADRGRIARWLGVESARPVASAASAASAAARAHPFDPPARNPMLEGWVEDRHVDYERHRVEGLWFVDEREHLHLGRNKPRTASGVADRAAHLHHVFVRSRSPLEAGRYSIRARITPTTSYVSGALVLGHTRRDRNLLVNFSGGDYQYAIGDKEEAAELSSIAWRLDGRFERDGGLAGAARAGEYGFAQPSSTFTLELVVEGGQAHLSIDGDPVGVYHTPTGLELAGYFGFAVSMGDYRVSELSVRRLDRSAALGALGDDPYSGWDLELPRRASFERLLNRSVRGVPRSERGALVLCLADAQGEPAEDCKRWLERSADFEAFRERYGLAIPAYVVAAGADSESLAALSAAAASLDVARAGGTSELLVRFPRAPAERARFDELAAADQLASDRNASWLLFIDSAGCLRVATSFHKSKRLDGALERWVEVFRNR